MYGTSDPYCWVKTSNKVAGGVVVTIGGFSWLAGWWKFNQRHLMARQVADGVCMGSVHFHGLHCLSCSCQWFGALDPSISSMTFQHDMGFHMYSILAPSSPPKNYGGKPNYKLSPEYIYIYNINILYTYITIQRWKTHPHVLCLWHWGCQITHICLEPWRSAFGHSQPWRDCSNTGGPCLARIRRNPSEALLQVRITS